MDAISDPNLSHVLSSEAVRFGKPLSGHIAPSLSTAYATVSKVEIVFTIAALFLSTGAFVNLLPGDQGLEGREQGFFFAQVAWSLLYIVMLWHIRKEIAAFGRLIWGQRTLRLLLGWAFMSVLWTIDRQVTSRHFVAVLLTSVLGAYFAVRYNPKEQLRLLVVSLSAVLSISAVACIVSPTYGISSDNPLEPPGWHGVLSSKNNLGTLAVLVALLLGLALLRGRRRGISIIGLVSVFVLIILTQSTSALLYFLLTIMAFAIVLAFRKYPAKRTKILWGALSVLSGFGLWTYYNWENFVSYLGKDPGLSGRFVLWGLSLEWIRERPLAGYGYDAFWSDYYGPAADFRAASGWLVATHAHNGFINLWLDLGFVGVLLFALGFIMSYRRALVLAKLTDGVEGLWPVVFLTFLFVYSLTEIGFMGRNDLYWILYVSVMTSLRRSIGQTPEKHLHRVIVEAGRETARD
jgi:O-antigen ligase